MTYDGGNLKVDIKDTTTNAVATQNYTVDIAATVGDGKAYVGFTGGTGSAIANQDILNWTFSSAITGLHVSKLVSVSPDPRNTPVDAIEVDFSENQQNDWINKWKLKTNCYFTLFYY